MLLRSLSTSPHQPDWSAHTAPPQEAPDTTCALANNTEKKLEVTEKESKRRGGGENECRGKFP